MSGRPPKATPEDVLEAMADSNEEFLWMREIAELVGYTQAQDVKDKLFILYADGFVDYRRENSFIWWITDEGLAHLDEIED